ncbi:hypothetical protein [Rufibacter sp. XAAS-G3-1]|uniref:hypothetical protein n=1 Tax=Rufibacter sp. XAAS-G3-1 TaxID=2729134 RepID=UPI0015E693D3|nr:hypothetical protein [Rufibacter sp. XAAS-G3-1]
MKRGIIIIVTLILSSKLHAQEKLDPISAPTSPASAVLGVQPSTVLTPKSYRALETALYSNFIKEGGSAIIPNDFSLEFTPYWFEDHSLPLEEYLYPKNAWDQITRTSSFSIASTQNFLFEDKSSTNGLAFGYRTRFYLSNKKDRDKISNYRSTLGRIDITDINFKGEIGQLLAGDVTIITKQSFLDKSRSVLLLYVQEKLKFDIDKTKEFVKNLYDKTGSLPELDRANIGLFLQGYFELINADVSNIDDSELIYEEFKEYIKQRQGLTVDLAYGTFLNFPTNNFKYSFVPRQSLWITPVYRFGNEISWLRALIVFRYEWSDLKYYKRYFPSSKVYKSNIDYGIAFNGDYKSFYWQLEAVGRRSNTEVSIGTDANGIDLFSKDKSSDFQYIGKLGYRINDNIALTYSLGNQFKPEFDPESTLVALLTLNFGFGGPTMDNLK